MTDKPAEDAYKRWTPAAQERALLKLRSLDRKPWYPFYCPRPNCDGNHHITSDPALCSMDPDGNPLQLGSRLLLHSWVKGNSRWTCKRCGTRGIPQDDWLFGHARADQHPPRGDWLTWLNRGGRGSGKTRTGAEWTHRRTKISPRIALIAPTGPDARIIMIEGDSGLLATAPPDKRPEWEPSKKLLTWPNGAQGFVFSAEEPDRLRGPQHFDAWIDEPCYMDNIDEVWSNLLFGLRLGEHPHICATTTPKPIPWMKEQVNDPDTISVVADTYKNIHNLAPIFAKKILKRYEGTRKGRQEIHGELLADVEGALWDYDYFEGVALRNINPFLLMNNLDRIVVAIDPAGTHRKKSDETGIVVVGVRVEGEHSHFYVLADYSGKYSPGGWAERALRALTTWKADYIVAENNYGGEMVRHTLESTVRERRDTMPRIEEVNSRRGKVIRADPIVALYEKHMVHHVGTELGTLEDQLVGWVPGSESPDRLDALVHGMTDLARTVDPALVASPTELRGLNTQYSGIPLHGDTRHLEIVRTA
jgi:phage terminase large subunit-like protein